MITPNPTFEETLSLIKDVIFFQMVLTVKTKGLKKVLFFFFVQDKMKLIILNHDNICVI